MSDTLELAKGIAREKVADGKGDEVLVIAHPDGLIRATFNEVVAWDKLPPYTPIEERKETPPPLYVYDEWARNPYFREKAAESAFDKVWPDSTDLREDLPIEVTE